MKFKTFLDDYRNEWVVGIVNSLDFESSKDDLSTKTYTPATYEPKAVFFSKEDAEEYCNFKNSKEAWDEMIKVK